jgi:hypothetical protein
MLYTANGEKVEFKAANLPAPDLPGFMMATDERISRGLVSSLSRFTRHVNSSWAGGRLEDQQDDPIIDQYRDTFLSAWQVVNEWFLDAVWLTSAVDLPGYSTLTAAMWSEFRAQFPGKVHINPTDTMKARAMGYALRTTTPQRSCEEDGLDLRENLREWAQAIQMAREIEAEFDLEEGALDYLLSDKAISATSTPPDEPTADPNGDPNSEDDKKTAPINRMRSLLNRLREKARE